jgi:hypothetical protein
MGTFSNKVGIVVGRKWRNLDVMSAYQPKVSNPNTKKQVEQRQRFGAASTLARGMKLGLAYGFAGVAAGTKSPARSRFVQANIHAVEFTFPDTIDIDYTMVKVSDGSHMNATYGSPTSTEPLQVDLTYSMPVVEGFSRQDDNVFALVFNPADGNCVLATERASAGSVAVTVPNSWNGEEVHVYAFVVGAEAGSGTNARPTDSTQVSETFYCGKVDIS